MTIELQRIVPGIGCWRVIIDGHRHIGSVSGAKGLGGYQFQANIPGRTTVFSTCAYPTARLAAEALTQLAMTS